MVLLRKSIPQNHNLKTAAELGVRQIMKFEYIVIKIIFTILFSLSASILMAEDYFSPKSLYDAARLQERSNPAEAIALYNSSARGGYVPAQLLLAGMHRSGMAGVEKSCLKSIYWYERAIELDSLEAQVRLASVYADTEDKCFLPEKAVPLYEAAVKNGHGGAQQAFALLYIRAIGVKKNYVIAYALLSAAMKNGVYESSLSVREIIEKDMTPAEIEKAKLLTKSYTAK